MIPTKIAMHVAREHIAWARSRGQSLLDICESITARRDWIYPTEDEALRAVALTWMRLKHVEMRRAA